MGILRLNQSTIGPNKFCVECVFDLDSGACQVASAEFMSQGKQVERLRQ